VYTFLFPGYNFGHSRKLWTQFIAGWIEVYTNAHHPYVHASIAFRQSRAHIHIYIGPMYSIIRSTKCLQWPAGIRPKSTYCQMSQVTLLPSEGSGCEETSDGSNQNHCKSKSSSRNQVERLDLNNFGPWPTLTYQAWPTMTYYAYLQLLPTSQPTIYKPLLNAPVGSTENNSEHYSLYTLPKQNQSSHNPLDHCLTQI